MLHGLVHDSAVVGTVKHAQHALKVTAKRSSHQQGVLADIDDLIKGFQDIKKIISSYKKSKSKKRK